MFRVSIEQGEQFSLLFVEQSLFIFCFCSLLVLVGKINIYFVRSSSGGIGPVNVAGGWDNDAGI